MRVPMTEYLEMDLDSERWLCRACGHDLASARGNYKEGTLVHDRDPREIHRPLIDPDRYEFTFAPDPALRSLSWSPLQPAQRRREARTSRGWPGCCR